MTAPYVIVATVTYGLDADAYLVAHDINRVLEGSGVRVMVELAGDDAEVWIGRRSEPVTQAVRFEPGQQLIVAHHGRWWIEPAPETAVAA